MTPEGAIAQLVTAFLFQLLDQAGLVRGEWGPVTDALGNEGYGIKFNYPDDPPLLDEDNAGIKIVDGNGNDIRFLWLDGPRSSDPVAFPAQIPGVMLSTILDQNNATIYAGNPASNFFPAIVDQIAAFIAIRSGTTPNYATASLMRAGRTVLALFGSTAGPGSAVLDRDDGLGNLDVATVQALAAPTVSNHNGTATGWARRIGNPGTLSIVEWQVNVEFAAGQGPTGDMQVTLPLAPAAGIRPVGSGMSSSSIGRVPLVASVITPGGSTPLIRPHTYTGAAAGLAPVLVHATAMNNAIMGVWGAGTWVSVSGSYIVD